MRPHVRHLDPVLLGDPEVVPARRGRRWRAAGAAAGGTHAELSAVSAEDHDWMDGQAGDRCGPARKRHKLFSGFGPRWKVRKINVDGDRVSFSGIPKII